MTTSLTHGALRLTADSHIPRKETAVLAERCAPRTYSDYGDIFMSLFERSGMSVAILDLQLRVLETNTAFFQQFGRLSTDVRGHGFCEFLHPSVRQHMLRQFARLTMGGRARLTERVVAIRPDGTTFAGELTGLAVPGDSAQIKTVVVLMRAERSKNDNPVIVDPYRTLTDLDAKILEGVAAGIPTVQLATKLYLSRQGVEYHVSAMLRKFKVPNRAALVAKAYAVGIFSVDCWPPAALPEYVK